MKKLLLLLIIPFLSFGQNDSLSFKSGFFDAENTSFSVQLGSTISFPFSSFEESSGKPEIGADIKTKLGFHGSMSYNFLNINDVIFLSPSLSYSLVNVVYNEEVGLMNRYHNWQNHLLNFSVTSRHIVNDRLTLKLGMSLDTKLFTNINTELSYNRSWITPDGTSDANLPPPDMSEEVKDVVNRRELLGLSGLFELKFNIYDRVYAFSNLYIPFLSFVENHSVEINIDFDGAASWSGSLETETFVRRRYLNLGIGIDL
jgi:hypothetical protein